MKFPNWFKIAWWGLWLVLVSILLCRRLPAITDGTSEPFDIFLFLIWVALILVPVFSEVELFGIKLRREMDELKNSVEIKLGEIKTEVRANQTQSITATFHGLPPPPPDNKLPQLENEIERVVKSRIKSPVLFGEQDVPDASLEMFKIRYKIESQLRRIWENRFQESVSSNSKGPIIIKILRELNQVEIIDSNIRSLLQEILAICNYAIHGKPVSQSQIQFVNKNAQEMIDYLAQIQ